LALRDKYVPRDVIEFVDYDIDPIKWIARSLAESSAGDTFLLPSAYLSGSVEPLLSELLPKPVKKGTLS
jgi:hypothetical protein